MNIRIKERVTGPTMDDHLKLVVDDFVEDVVSDCRMTPDQFPDTDKRNKFGIPFRRTGTLVLGIFFKPASRGGVKSGLLGTVMAPEGRFEGPAGKFMRAGFLKLVDALHVARGVGWSRSRKGGR